MRELSFRMPVMTYTDLKLQQLTDAQFRVWFNLLCYAARLDTNGVIPVETIPDYPDDDNRWGLLSIECAFNNKDLLLTTLDRLMGLSILKYNEDAITFLRFGDLYQFTKKR